MATNIFKFDGTLLTTVADGTIDTTHASIKFPGRGYQNYGQPVMEGLLWVMQNFAGTTQPSLPMTGQCWYDTNTGVLRVYNGTNWQTAGGTLVNNTNPTATTVGALWYDSLNLQLKIWNGTSWDLIGPLGSAINNDPTAPAVPSHSAWESIKINDSSTSHQVWRLTIGGQIVAIISKDQQFSPVPVIQGFSTILPGINFNSTVSNIGLAGDITAFRSTKNNLPDEDSVRSLGSVDYRFSSVYSINGVFSNGIAVNTTTGSYKLNVNGSSYLNGPTLLMKGTASNAPLRLQAQTSLLSSPAVGAIEFDGSQLYVTLDVGGTPIRSAIVAGTSGTSAASVPNTVVLRDGSADVYANVFHGIATSARYADVAERYETDVPVLPGDVVIIGGDKEITLSTVANDDAVFGVISTDPAYRMNEDAGSDQTHPFVALVGRVPCKVSGKVRKGQRLVTSDIPGVAMAQADRSNPLAAFARALCDKDDDDISIIEVVLAGRS